MNIKPKTYDIGDYCLRTSLYCAGKIMQNSYNYEESNLMYQMIKDCRFNSFYQIKSHEYKWSNSGSENKNDNTFWKRPTYWLYHNILKHIRKDPYKGANGDQLRAFFIVMYLKRYQSKYKKIWLKIFLGFIFRFGFTPSLCEFAPLRPQAYILFLLSAPYGLKYLLLPFILISKICFYISFYREINFIPIELSTTNKISLLPTALLLKHEGFPTFNYCKKVYEEYFKGDLNFIGQSIFKGIIENAN